MPSKGIYNGNYDALLNAGKFTIKKDDIKKYIFTTYNYYIYIIVKKIDININIIYKHVEGQFIFLSMDYIYSTIPEGFYISNYFIEEQNTPHLYTIFGKNVTIEFSNPEDKLICKILKYKSYQNDSEELFIDYNNFCIIRRVYINKTIIHIVNFENISNQTNNLIISIFSKNNEHNADPNSKNLSYNIKYYINNLNEEIIKRPKAIVVLLGFARYVYINYTKICSFYIYFARIREILYSEILIIKVRIKYKIISSSLRVLQENINIKDAECKLNKSDFDNQIYYICSLETNGEQIEKIEFIDDLGFHDQLIEVKSKTPIAKQYIDNLQNIGDKDIFNKKLFIL